jgi:hypothetical protein
VCDRSCLAPDKHQKEVLHLPGEGGSTAVSDLVVEVFQAVGIHPSHSGEQTLQNASLFANIEKGHNKNNFKNYRKVESLGFFPHDNQQTLTLDFLYCT